jgi:hypothetical protein
MWDVLVYEGHDSTEAWFKATRLFLFFYDQKLDANRAIQLVRWLVNSKEEVDDWLRRDNFQWVLIRLTSILLKSVGSLGDLSEYVFISLPADIVVNLTCWWWSSWDSTSLFSTISYRRRIIYSQHLPLWQWRWYHRKRRLLISATISVSAY